MFKLLTRRPYLVSLSLPSLFTSNTTPSPPSAPLAAPTPASNPISNSYSSSSSTTTTSTTTSMPARQPYPITPYPGPRHASWPYTPSDFQRMDPRPDADFYESPRFVTHIDDNAISALRSYYAKVLPAARGGDGGGGGGGTARILELCSSWVSHLPPELEAAARRCADRPPRTPPVGTSEGVGADVVGLAQGQGQQSLRRSNGDGADDGTLLWVTGYGMNHDELAANPVLAKRVLRDLNEAPDFSAVEEEQQQQQQQEGGGGGGGGGGYDAAMCVVSIDYLTRPREVLEATRKVLRPGAQVHLVISNRCFPTKAVARWLEVGEQERLLMVGDYLWWSGFREIEIVTLEDGKKAAGWFTSNDPLWVVRGKKP